MDLDNEFASEYDAALRDMLRKMKESGEYNPSALEVIRKRMKDLNLDVVPTIEAEATKKEYDRAMRVVKGGKRGSKSA